MLKPLIIFSAETDKTRKKIKAMTEKFDRA